MKRDISNATLNDIYAVCNRLEDKMDSRLAKVDDRLDALEDFRGRIIGFSLLLSVLVSTAGTWLWNKLTKA